MARGHKINAPATSAEPARPLKVEVRDALLGALRDPAAPGAAIVVSAARSLLEFFGDEGAAGDAPIELMDIDDIDRELAGNGPGARPRDGG